VTKEGDDFAVANGNINYTIKVTNGGPSNAADAKLTDQIPTNATFVSVAKPSGWTCATPAVGSSGTVSCSTASLAPGTASFGLVVRVNPSTPTQTVITNTASVSSPTPDPVTSNNSASKSTTVVNNLADLSVTNTAAPSSVRQGNNITYTIRVTNGGPNPAAAARLTDEVPANTTFVSMAAPSGWQCDTPVVGARGTVSCTIPNLAVGRSDFTLVVKVDAGAPDGTIIDNIATASSTTPEPTPNDNSAKAQSTVNNAADLSVTNSDSPDPVAPGSEITYLITASNGGPNAAKDPVVRNEVPANTTFSSVSPNQGWTCTSPVRGGTGAVECTVASLASGQAATFRIVVRVNPSAADGSTITDRVTVASPTADPNSANNSAAATTSVRAPSQPTTPTTQPPNNTTTTQPPNNTTTTQPPNNTTTTQPPTTSTTAPPAPGESSTVRIAGEDRLMTAVEVSRRQFGDRSALAVVIARADDFPDALAAAPLAASAGGPLLLTIPGGLDQRVLEEVRRVLPSGRTVFVAGGEGAVSTAVETQLRDAGYEVRRFSGRNRFETATLIAENNPNPSAALLVTGTNFPDALAAGAAASRTGGVVLLTAGSTMPAETQAYLQVRPQLPRFAIGGPAAGADPGATSVIGTDRFDTSVQVATRFFEAPTAVGIASGLNFPDALAGGPHVGASNGPLLLTPFESLPGSVRNYLTDHRSGIAEAFIYGGTSAVSQQVKGEVDAALG